MRSHDGHPGHGRFWFGTGLAQFLSAELKDFPGRRVAAARLFAVTLIIALVSQTLHIPPLGALAILVCLSYDAYANAGQSLAFGLRQLYYLFVTVLIAVLILVLAGNDPWLLLSLSFVVMALALFHARLIAWPTGIALWYSIPVLYSPTAPDAAIHSALWNIPIIGVLGLGTWTLVHLSIKPQDPRRLLVAGLAEELAAVAAIFGGRLADAGVAGQQKPPHKPAAGGHFAKLRALLGHAELLHPAMRRQHDTYLALLLEIDGLRQLAVWLDQSLTADYRAQPLSPEKLAVYLALQNACTSLGQSLAAATGSGANPGAVALDEAILAGYSQAGQPSLMTAFWRALQRIAVLAGQLQRDQADTGRKTGEADDEAMAQWRPAWLYYSFWAEHADSLQYGIKFSLGAILCMLIVQALDWPDINTAIPTCLVAAQTSLGADYRLSLLRISGAAIGGLCAYVYVLVLQAQFDTVIGFTLATTPFWALAAWITAGSDRIAYLGRQLGFSFALFVLHDFGAVTDLYLPRDRVIGILLGLLVMGVLDYALWPRRSSVLARRHCIGALRTLAKFTVRLPDPGHLISYTLPLRLAAEKDLAAAQDLLAHAVLEPDARLPDKLRERAALRAIIRDAERLSSLLQIRKRYRLLSGQQFGKFPEQLQQHSLGFDAALAQALEQTAEILQGERHDSAKQAAQRQAQLKQSYVEHHRIDSLPADWVLEWELRFMLDEQITELLGSIQTSALNALP
ncbi:fusaric acid resistance protein [Methylomonas koyamae]|uniref:Fusaric acid resistance protein n=1 Tax=Methylomonas koyamae TaxID=702114 RepID=A0A177NND5_9GAMM|nr:FUSC family protein [Methylomonas koyamae]OAI19352.1 fusaric acid resistance protein [Methylomonas koyamae]